MISSEHVDGAASLLGHAGGRPAFDLTADGGHDAHETSEFRYAAPLGGSKGSAIRALPSLFVLCLISCVTSIYLGFHISPLLQEGKAAGAGEGGAAADAHAQGTWQLAVFVPLFGMMMICFALAVFVNPGSPESSPVEEGKETNEAVELKISGERRSCKWCDTYKPDRTHHCRVCRTCMLRMDHHCPWISNCVGWGNHKYFMLLLGYSVLTCLFVAITMSSSVIKVIDLPSPSFLSLFSLLLAQVLVVFLTLLTGGFLAFHLHLLVAGSTTIEFCEKRFKRGNAPPQQTVDWNLGFAKNFMEVFGPNPLLWFLPIDNRRGDGKHFSSNSADICMRHAGVEAHLRMKQAQKQPTL